MVKFERLPSNEEINVWRAPVPNGWLVVASRGGYNDSGTGVTFVPDIQHVWGNPTLLQKPYG